MISTEMKKKEFAAKIIERRKAKGYTQEELAEKCKVTVRTIQRIESGAVTPRAFTVKLISDALDYDFFPITKDLADNTLQGSGKRNQISKIKDLFNLKTITMKKATFLLSTLLIIVTGLFALGSEINAQSAKENHAKSSTLIQYNDDKSLKSIEVGFTGTLTFDSLVSIRNNMKDRGITITYKKLTFDEKNHLLSIDCDVDCNDGMKGSFGSDEFTEANKENRIGFRRDYSKNAKVRFATGTLKD